MLSRAAFILALSGGGVLAQQEGAETSAPVEVTAETPELPEDLSDAEAGAAAALPLCDALPDTAAGLVDCTLDEAGTILTFDFTGPDDAPRLTVTQSAPEGGERRVSDPIRVTGVTLAPRLTDLDGDGSFELFLPVGRAGDETLFELWLPDADQFFARRDEIIAASTDAIVARDALLVLVSPDADAPDRRVETTMILEPQGLTELYRLAIDETAQTCILLGSAAGANLNAALIEADCADRAGFAPPETAPTETVPPETAPVRTESPPAVSPKEI